MIAARRGSGGGGTGCVIVIVVDITLNGLHEYPPVWIDVASSVLFTIAMGILMMSSINADPLTLFSSRKRATMRRDWLRVRAVVPLIVGTFAAYIGATVFNDFFDVDVVRTLDPEMAAEVHRLPLNEQLDVLSHLCSNAVNPFYFQHMVEVLPPPHSQRLCGCWWSTRPTTTATLGHPTKAVPRLAEFSRSLHRDEVVLEVLQTVGAAEQCG
jgi:hypothetical protein